MNSKKPKILIVDDEKGFTKVTRLSMNEFEVCEENNPTRALETARSFQPDLILLDVVMPEMDGGDIAALIKAELRRSDELPQRKGGP